MDPTTSQEYLIIGDQFLWFGAMTDCSIINPNQVGAFNIPVHDNNFDAKVFGIEAEKALNPCTSKGTIISFESPVPKAREEQNLPVIFILGDQWHFMNVELGIRTR